MVVAQEQYGKYADHYDEALESNAVPAQKAILEVREERYIKRMAPSLARKSLELINGSDQISTLGAFAVAGSRTEFRSQFERLLKERGNGLSDELSTKPKLLTEVITRVMSTMKAARKE